MEDNDTEAPDLVEQLMDLLSQVSDHSLTGFAVVTEWLGPEGERSLLLLKPPTTAVWELQGWLYHLLNDPAAYDVAEQWAEAWDEAWDEDDLED